MPSTVAYATQTYLLCHLGQIRQIAAHGRSSSPLFAVLRSLASSVSQFCCSIACPVYPRSKSVAEVVDWAFAELFRLGAFDILLLGRRCVLLRAVGCSVQEVWSNLSWVLPLLVFLLGCSAFRPLSLSFLFSFVYFCRI